ncbi:hypothetical protein FNV43_RR14808 [Rhamnella rubrinervis]|uniref:Uncharacterized protein n=1 Tax=Rhamnella rubrinervis TaxID=2594499 RepID=A0A8K0MGQ6_9ROSA|nr:hypothetical protein FNV43_RR14808 [Rhamnella rubrinervis]
MISFMLCVFHYHIKAMLKIAKLLHSKGFRVTFVNTEFNHNRFLKSLGPNSLDDFPDFRFETIPDGLPSSDANATQDLISLGESLRRNALGPLLELLRRLSNTSRPVTRILSDGFFPVAITAGEQLGIPVVLFYRIPACAFMDFKQFSAIVEKLGPPPVLDERSVSNSYLDKVVDWIPGMKDMHVRDLPCFCWTGNTEDQFLFDFTMESAEKAHKASAVILHTFYTLKQDILDAISSMFPKLFSIGPLQILLNQLPENPSESTSEIMFLITHPLEGMEINKDVKRDEVEKLVRELIEGDKGKEMQKKVEWKRLAQDATSPVVLQAMTWIIW